MPCKSNPGPSAGEAESGQSGFGVSQSDGDLKIFGLLDRGRESRSFSFTCNTVMTMSKPSSRPSFGGAS